MVEVAVATVAEAVTGHLDGRAEALSVEEVGQLLALAGVQQRHGDRVAVRVEPGAQRIPVEGVDAIAGADGGGRHQGVPPVSLVRLTPI